MKPPSSSHAPRGKPAAPTSAPKATRNPASPQNRSHSVTLALPWPPTVNTYWRRVNNRTILSAKARAYRASVTAETAYQTRFGTDRLRINITAHPPDKRQRDLDNLPKGVLDALSFAGVFADDSQVDDLRITRAERVKDGQLIVTITSLELEDPA